MVGGAVGVVGGRRYLRRAGAGQTTVGFDSATAMTTAFGEIMIL